MRSKFHTSPGHGQCRVVRSVNELLQCTYRRKITIKDYCVEMQILRSMEEDIGMVYWITGLSGAGKTTIGKLFYKKLREENTDTVFLDGDALRKVLGDDLGYSREERERCAMRYSRLCALLEEQGINVVCCTISMFDNVRAWNRANIHNYIEIYVKASMDTLLDRDQKGLYSGNTNEESKEVVGVHINYEEPKCPDLILGNDGELTPEEQVSKIFSFLKKNNYMIER